MAVDGAVGLGGKVKMRSRLIPFEQLPNLPKPVFTPIDLGITHMDLGFTRKSVLAIEPAIADQRRVGYFKADEATQTDESDIVELKHVTGTIGVLMQDIEQLRDDLGYTQHVMKIDYENQINKRATELYSHANERIGELEMLHAEKVEVIRKSYRSQLSNAISKIAGEYKAYYDEILHGSTGRHDARIKELRHKVEILEHRLAESEEEVQGLKEALEVPRVVSDESGKLSPPIVDTTQAETEHSLRMNVVKLENELEDAQNQLAAREDSVRKYRRQSETLIKQLDDERVRMEKLMGELESLHTKSAADKEKAERQARSQRDVLEKEMKQNMAKAQKQASKKATEMAEMQCMKDMARYQQEMDQKKGLENSLRQQALMASSSAMPDTELSKELEKMKKLSTKQQEELVRVTKESERRNQVWETKFSIMQKNFHALKDESYLRQQFQRQSAILHYATVGYAAAPSSAAPAKQIRVHPKVRGGIRREAASSVATTVTVMESRGSMMETPMETPLFEGPPVPTPTPTLEYQTELACEASAEQMHRVSVLSDSRPRSIVFEERRGGLHMETTKA